MATRPSENSSSFITQMGYFLGLIKCPKVGGPRPGGPVASAAYGVVSKYLKATTENDFCNNTL